MGKSRRLVGDGGAVSAGGDNYLNAVTALRRVISEANLPEGPIERLEVTQLASGELTYRVWEPRAEESEGGYIPAP